jgi:hypothetical protein
MSQIYGALNEPLVMRLKSLAQQSYENHNAELPTWLSKEASLDDLMDNLTRNDAQYLMIVDIWKMLHQQTTESVL